ncbi:MAG: ABC transporter ATP-binding protein [Chlamydiota bacterium]
MSRKKAVVCKGITKVFGEGPTRVDVLRGVDLEVYEGELLMLMGPSGSGKTTLISIIAGILTQTGGDCLIADKDINHTSDDEKTSYRGKHIGFVFQSFNLIPMLSCAENVAIPLLLNHVEKKAAEDRGREALKEMEIGEKADVSPRNLSGGQQQRVAIARAMVHGPDLIVCDEPTSCLDHEMGLKIMGLLKKISMEKKKTVIVVSHDLRIVNFADRIVHLEDGKIV